MTVAGAALALAEPGAVEPLRRLLRARARGRLADRGRRRARRVAPAGEPDRLDLPRLQRVPGVLRARRRLRARSHRPARRTGSGSTRRGSSTGRTCRCSRSRSSCCCCSPTAASFRGRRWRARVLVRRSRALPCLVLARRDPARAARRLPGRREPARHQRRADRASSSLAGRRCCCSPRSSRPSRPSSSATAPARELARQQIKWLGRRRAS